jgi:hypothetical protein
MAMSSERPDQIASAARPTPHYTRQYSFFAALREVSSINAAPFLPLPLFLFPCLSLHLCLPARVSHSDSSNTSSFTLHFPAPPPFLPSHHSPMPTPFTPHASRGTLLQEESSRGGAEDEEESYVAEDEGHSGDEAAASVSWTAPVREEGE